MASSYIDWLCPGKRSPPFRPLQERPFPRTQRTWQRIPPHSHERLAHGCSRSQASQRKNITSSRLHGYCKRRTRQEACQSAPRAGRLPTLQTYHMFATISSNLISSDISGISAVRLARRPNSLAMFACLQLIRFRHVSIKDRIFDWRKRGVEQGFIAGKNILTGYR